MLLLDLFKPLDNKLFAGRRFCLRRSFSLSHSFSGLVTCSLLYFLRVLPDCMSSPPLFFPQSTIDVSCSPEEIKTLQTQIASEPESVPSDSSAASPPDPTASEACDSDASASSAPVQSEVSEAAVTMDQDASAAPSQSQGNKKKEATIYQLNLQLHLEFMEFYFIIAQCLVSRHNFTIFGSLSLIHGVIFRWNKSSFQIKSSGKKTHCIPNSGT